MIRLYNEFREEIPAVLSEYLGAQLREMFVPASTVESPEAHIGTIPLCINRSLLSRFHRGAREGVVEVKAPY